MSNAHEHLPLRVGVLYLLHLDDLVFVENLDGIESAVVFGADKMHTSKGSGSQPVGQSPTRSN